MYTREWYEKGFIICLEDNYEEDFLKRLGKIKSIISPLCIFNAKNYARKYTIFKNDEYPL